MANNMYDKVDTGPDFAGREHEVLNFWNEKNIFGKSIEQRKGGPVFTFYDGPPTANGKPHIGHIITRAVKDCIPRYKAMKGFYVLRKAGWDTHGLPVELEVEKKLEINGKPDIERYGIEPFIKQCKESVWLYEGQWREMSERVGFWADMDDPYVTYHNGYIESVWWALSEMWKKGLIYKGHRVVPYCPRCGTPLSSHEVAQGYKDVKDVSAIVKFRSKEDPLTYYLAWTTTPWTLPSNVALCVNAREDYVRVLIGGEYFILAGGLAEGIFPGCSAVETFKGAALAGKKYEPLFPRDETPDGLYCAIVADDYVTLADGSGIVHIAPAFGEDDSRVGKANGLAFVQLVDEQGRFTATGAAWDGLTVKEADPHILSQLKKDGLLFKESVYEHNYPHCWRCDTPLIYYAREAWFIRVTAMRDALVANNNTVNWLPDNIRTGRFGNFLENVIDWSVSRERYWGTPLPVWECPCGYAHCIGSEKELREMGRSVPSDLEFHKPYIDEVKLACPKCGGEMTRVPEVIDCWFDAGAMPFAQWHYPFENADLFEQNFPADFISEAVDQTRGWFYSLMAESTIIFGRSPFKNCIVLGHVQDIDGQKMSKHLGNVIDPMEQLAKHGADAVRWYFFVNSAPWLPSKYADTVVEEASRKFLGTLWNTYAFYVLYAEIDGFNPYGFEKSSRENLPVMDRWILSRLNTLTEQVDSCLEKYELTEPSRALLVFTDELSNWYVRRCRERFWCAGMPRDKADAFLTLHETLVTVAKLAAPFVPFVTELIYQNLVAKIDPNAPASVHLCDYPAADAGATDKPLEADMERAQRVVAQGRAARNAAAVKNRQPLPEILVKINGGDFSPQFAEIILDELNIKKLTHTDDVSAYSSFKCKPQLKTLGPRYGKLVPKIAEHLAAHAEAVTSRLKKGDYSFFIDGEEIVLAAEDVLTETIHKEGFSAQTDRDAGVVLDIRLTPELIEEGFVRELVSKLQTMRKEAGFEVTDRISAGHIGNENIAGVFERNAALISSEILAENISQAEAPAAAYKKEWNINGETVSLWVLR